MQIRGCPGQRAALIRPAAMLCKVGDLSLNETAFRLQHGRNAATGCTAANVCSSGSNSQRGQPPSCQPLPGAECPISAHPGPKAVRQQTTRGGYQSSYRHTSPNVCIRAIASRPGTTEMGAIQNGWPRTDVPRTGSKRPRCATSGSSLGFAVSPGMIGGGPSFWSTRCV
jgi:hypothetical protein